VTTLCASKSEIDSQAVVLMMLPSALLRLSSAELTPLDATSRFAINAPSSDPVPTLAKTAIVFPADAAPGVLGRNKAAAWLPLMLLIDMTILGQPFNPILSAGI
jgi:hypothetical protein